MCFSLKEYTAPDFKKPELEQAPNAALVPAPMDGVAPDDYHATSIFPEYFKVDGKWLLAEESRMDCVAVYKNDRVVVWEFRHLKKGDLVFTGRSENGSLGIYVHTDGFDDTQKESGESFAFRQGRSRETAFSINYDSLYEQLNYEKEHGYIVWVAGPACTFDADSRNAFSSLCANGYVHALLAGNALATHDLEAAYKKSALGQDIYTQISYPNGHYNHIDTINRARYCGTIPAFIEQENIRDGIMYNCVKHNIPFVLTGSIRDDGPLPGVYADVYAGQDAMRKHISKATTIICMATTLHAIAAGNIAPSFRVMPDGKIRQVYFYMVDISEFAANKLGDRGSLSAKSIITNTQDFIVHIYKNLICG
jgi:lysine-ketoglutarate reductase/saccharopine dehydrogenase-like protein (TIGR00300 family)